MTGSPMKQLSFSDAEYAGQRKRTRREVFLAEVVFGLVAHARLGAGGDDDSERSSAAGEAAAGASQRTAQ